MHDLFARGERLVTLTGPGGVGKTRLAEELTAGRLPFASECLFVDLTAARSADDVIMTTARALNVALTTSEGRDDSVAIVGRALAGRRRLLVVFDNVEQVVGAAAPFVGKWVDAAPEARVLATSRERLRIEGESAIEIEPLPVAKGTDTTHAVELFFTRAESTGAALDREPATVAAVQTIVERLDGIPLAIELAAARARVLGVDQLRARLDKRLDLLGGGPRAATARQATLRGAIDWSWNLLDAEEQQALAELSSFRGGFTAASAEAVLTAASPLDVLASLRDKSLVTGLRDGARLALYETIREYAAEKLASGATEGATFSRHAAHFLASAEGWTAVANGPARADSVRQLATEQDNLVAVVERAIERGDRSTALRMLVALEPLQRSRAPAAPYIALLDAALPPAGAAHDGEDRLVANALLARAGAHRTAGATDASSADVERAVALAEGAADAKTLATALAALGDLTVVRGGARDAIPIYERALGLALRAGDARLHAVIRADLGYLASRFGRIDEAIVNVSEALVALEVSGDKSATAVATYRLAGLFLEHGRLDDASSRYRSALEMFKTLGDRRYEGATLYGLAEIEQDRGRLAAAEALYLEALAIRREVGPRRGEGVVLGYLGLLHHEQLRLDVAEARLRDAIVILSGVGDRRSAAFFEGALAGVLAAEDRLAEAEAAFQRAGAALHEQGDPLRLGALEVELGHLDLLRARRSKGAAAAAHIAAATSRVAAARRERPTGPSLAAASNDVRFALHALEGALAALAPSAESLVIEPDASLFRPPRGEARSLESRPMLRAILVALLDHRLDHPGDALDVDALAARGWPGETMLPAAAYNRVNVAISTLRKLGLKDVLMRRDDGWLLDPATPTVRATVR